METTEVTKNSNNKLLFKTTEVFYTFKNMTIEAPSVVYKISKNKIGIDTFVLNKLRVCERY